MRSKRVVRLRGDETQAPSEGGTSPGFPSPDDTARRAYDLFLARGGEPGRDLEDWFAAEKELKGQSTSVA